MRKWVVLAGSAVRTALTRLWERPKIVRVRKSSLGRTCCLRLRTGEPRKPVRAALSNTQGALASPFLASEVRP